MIKKLPFKPRGFIAGDQLQNYFLANRVKPVPIARLYSQLDKEICKTLSTIYTTVLQSICDMDTEFLSGIMEKRLYDQFSKAFNEIEAEKYTLEFINTDTEDLGTSQEDQSADPSQKKRQVVGNGKTQAFGYTYVEKDLNMYVEPKGVFGARIERDQNPSDTLVIGNDTLSKRVYLNPKRLADIINNQILVLNVYYFTNRKIVIRNSNGDIIEGDDNPSTFYDHKFRFETYLDNIDWVLTDVDDHLRGNPYNWVKEAKALGLEESL